MSEGTIDKIQVICVDFGLPFIILAMLFTLMLTGIDGEVKTLMATVVGWITKSGISYVKKQKAK